MVSSLSSGQGDKALHGRLRYADNLEESRADGFAELYQDDQHKIHELMEADGSIPRHGIAYTRQDGGKLFDQVWSVPGLFQLLDDTDDDIIVDALCINLTVR